MRDTIHRLVDGKSVAILGFGREGRATFPWLLNESGIKSLTIVDKNPVTLPDDIPDSVKDSIRIVTGEQYQKCLNEFDVVFKSPGIVLEEEISHYTCKIVSEMDVFFETYRNQIIGITGTKGKSTTTTLLYHVLKNAGKKALLAGNIGIPVFDIAEDIDIGTLLVVELSCHQLEYAVTSPHISVLLNIHEEHLDHYGTMEKYTAAKENIYRNQMEGDVLFCEQKLAPKNGPMKVVTVAAEGIGGDESADVYVKDETIRVNRDTENEVYNIPAEEIELMGQHNYYDIAYVYSISRMLGLSPEEIEDGLKSYIPLPHRLQKIGVVNGVTFYDDSISTIDETTIQALKTLKNADSVIIGGMDRGISYDSLEEYLSTSTVSHIILMEETGKRIYREIEKKHPDFKNKERIILVEHLADAVKTAKKVTAEGKACVMSPAAASYGIFKNFEERGEEFKKLVLGS